MTLRLVHKNSKNNSNKYNIENKVEGQDKNISNYFVFINKKNKILKKNTPIIIIIKKKTQNMFL